MSQSMNQTFDPFSRHRGKTEAQPEPMQAQPVEATEAPAVDQPAKSKPVESEPSVAARADNPFDIIRSSRKLGPNPNGPRNRNPLNCCSIGSGITGPNLSSASETYKTAAPAVSGIGKARSPTRRRWKGGAGSSQ
jgi:hypothetical protein